MQTSINERIKILIDSLEEGNQSAFATRIGVSRAVVNNIIGGRMNEPSFKVLQKIPEAYAEVSLQWLLTGEGPKFVGSPSHITGNRIKGGSGSAMGIGQGNQVTSGGMNSHLLTNKIESTINQRIEELINFLEKGKQASFAKKIDVSPSVINNIIGGRMNKPSFDVMQKIIDAYANVNLSWLMTGEGQMLKEGEHKTNGYSISGVKRSNIAGGAGSSVTTSADSRVEELKQELQRTKEELELWRNKYITLLENMAKS